MKKVLFIFTSFAVLALISPQPAMAYVGPGLGLGVIGAIIGVILSVLLAIFVILWYPIKRWLGIGKKAKPSAEQCEHHRDG